MNDTAVSAIPERVHLVGVGGVHMSGIARILRFRGHTVSGSDTHLSHLTAELETLGVTVHKGHAPQNIDDAQLVVYTSAAHEDNAELQESRARRIETIKRATMIARLMIGKKVIAIAGTHGKTTTTALVGFMLQRAGLSPTIMLGGESIDLGTNAVPGEGDYFVVEADEYDRAFLEYSPYIALVTNVEPDHPDIYPSAEDLQRAFAQFLSQVDNTGYIIACMESPALQAILPPTVGDDMNPNPVHVVSYGLSPASDWMARDINKIERQKGIDTSSFMVEFQKQAWGRFETQLPGVHNVLNSLGAIAVGHALGLDRETIGSAVAEFRGVHRRFELIGEEAGVMVFDDYAHHPTEVRATLTAARARFPGRRLVCLFQPHTFSRTSFLLDDFRTCFAGCDALYLADTYAAREQPAAGMSAEQLAG
ncbi:MAG TPA: UDP-N-acetylmuramate--L-alanine ligase, partial [Dehalococcoidia bacterium]|nr:UDP-N-acetylmuramate--L-alanine ligase [Dehalococcoidia bacterium]